MPNPRWLSKPAVLWAMDEAPAVPARLVSTLLVYARYADQEGRGSYPRTVTVAARTRKSVRRVRRDTAELERLGLLLPGDPGLVKEIRADRRPKVYDLAMPRGDADDTPPEASRGDADDTPSERPGAGAGWRTGSPRGDAQGRHGVTPRPPRKDLKRSRKSLSAHDRDLRALFNGGGATEREINLIITTVSGDPTIRDPHAYLAKPNVRADLLAKVRRSGGPEPVPPLATLLAGLGLTPAEISTAEGILSRYDATAGDPTGSVWTIIGKGEAEQLTGWLRQQITAEAQEGGP